MKWVIDASVAAKWVVPEADSAIAESLLDDELHTPDLLLPEASNILWKKQTRGELAATTVDAAARWLMQVPLHVYASDLLMLRSLALASRLQHPAYDCFYLSLAERVQCRLVTADRRLFLRCQQADVPELRELVVLLSALGSALSH